MKKLFIALLICLFTIPAISADVNTDRRVEWEQDQATVNVLTHWELFWSDTAGGPYVKITDIAKPVTPPSGGVYVLDPISLTVSGNPGSVVTKYFVMRAATADMASDWSNEATSDFLIGLGVPFSVRVIVVTKPE